MNPLGQRAEFILPLDRQTRGEIALTHLVDGRQQPAQRHLDRLFQRTAEEKTHDHDDAQQHQGQRLEEFVFVDELRRKRADVLGKFLDHFIPLQPRGIVRLGVILQAAGLVGLEHRLHLGDDGIERLRVVIDDGGERPGEFRLVAHQRLAFLDDAGEVADGLLLALAFRGVVRVEEIRAHSVAAFEHVVADLLGDGFGMVGLVPRLADLFLERHDEQTSGENQDDEERQGDAQSLDDGLICHEEWSGNGAFGTGPGSQAADHSKQPSYQSRQFLWGVVILGRAGVLWTPRTRQRSAVVPFRG